MTVALTTGGGVLADVSTPGHGQGEGPTKWEGRKERSDWSSAKMPPPALLDVHKIGGFCAREGEKRRERAQKSRFLYTERRKTEGACTKEPVFEHERAKNGWLVRKTAGFCAREGEKRMVGAQKGRFLCTAGGSAAGGSAARGSAARGSAGRGNRQRQCENCAARYFTPKR